MEQKKDSAGTVLAIVSSCGVALGFLITQLVFGLIFTTVCTLKYPAIIADAFKSTDKSAVFSLMASFFGVFMTDVMAVFVIWFANRKEKTELFNPVNNKTILTFTAVTMLLWVFNCFWSAVIPQTWGEDARHLTELASKINITAFMLCFLSPLAEELTFRYAVVKIFKHFKSDNTAFCIITSAMLFAIAHGNIAQAVPAVIMGGLFAYFYIKTDNIAVPVAMHAFFNTSGELTQFIPTVGMCGVYGVIGMLILITLLTAKRRHKQ